VRGQGFKDQSAHFLLNLRIGLLVGRQSGEHFGRESPERADKVWP